jgi:hypothetical protein
VWHKASQPGGVRFCLLRPFLLKTFRGCVGTLREILIYRYIHPLNSFS